MRASGTGARVSWETGSWLTLNLPFFDSLLLLPSLSGPAGSIWNLDFFELPLEDERAGGWVSAGFAGSLIMT